MDLFGVIRALGYVLRQSQTSPAPSPRRSGRPNGVKKHLNSNRCYSLNSLRLENSILLDEFACLGFYATEMDFGHAIY